MAAVDCAVWVATLDQARPGLAPLLSAAEARRRAEYRSPPDRDRYLLGAVLLRLAAAEHAGTAPDRVVVDRTCPRCGLPHGKPAVPDGDRYYSISHSGDYILLADTAAAAVGVDVEEMVDRDIAGMTRLVLAPGERLRDGADRLGDFFAHWCRKEAVLKATGDGLQVPMSTITLAPAGGPVGLVSYQGRPRDCAIADLPIAPGYAGAVAVLAAGELAVRLRGAVGLLASAA